ncbi:hypothetical protein AA14337_3200 [Acetobacter malorum DSM 14337]|uniref:Uncharacterized protein n=1 Tax=Acetobacter malorum DSM 14337 TaxID=1307910 RepID=A0ABQ0Q080_9PROT|nr:hypothetical protein AA14337_3200 [Acetobacter malorum DSM 14337]
MRHKDQSGGSDMKHWGNGVHSLSNDVLVPGRNSALRTAEHGIQHLRVTCSSPASAQNPRLKIDNEVAIEVFAGLIKGDAGKQGGIVRAKPVTAD